MAHKEYLNVKTLQTRKNREKRAGPRDPKILPAELPAGTLHPTVLKPGGLIIDHLNSTGTLNSTVSMPSFMLVSKNSHLPGLPAVDGIGGTVTVLVKSANLP